MQTEKTKGKSFFGELIYEFFQGEEGIFILQKLVKEYGYSEEFKRNLYIDQDTDEMLEVDDITKDGYITLFAPDYKEKSIHIDELIDIVSSNLDDLSSDLYFNQELFLKDKEEYIIGHPFFRNAIKNAFASSLLEFLPERARFIWPKKGKEEKKLYLTISYQTLEIFRRDWRNLSFDEKLDLFSITFTDNCNVLPNVALCTEIDMYGYAKVALIERRVNSSVYMVVQSGHIYQISKEDPNNAFWIFNNYDEYQLEEPIDDIEEKFHLPKNNICYFYKDENLYITDNECIGHVSPAQRGVSSFIDKFDFIVEISDEEKILRMNKLISRIKRAGNTIPLYSRSTLRYINKMKKYIDKFVYKPINWFY